MQRSRTPTRTPRRPTPLSPAFLLLLLFLHSSFAFLMPTLPVAQSVPATRLSAAATHPASLLYTGFWVHALEMMKARQATLPWEPLPVPAHLQRNTCTTLGKGKRPDTSTTAEIFAYGVPGRVRQARAAVLATSGDVPPKVLNFVIFPEPTYDLPIFGADFVALPGGHLIVLDFQPVSPGSLRVAEAALESVHATFSAQLPVAGEIPDAAKAYFSKYYLFVRSDADELVATTVLDAFKAYFAVYLDLIENAQPVPAEEAGRRDEILQGHVRYATYRAVNDPARGMLTRMYGHEWTEEAIYDVLFDMATKPVVGEKKKGE